MESRETILIIDDDHRLTQAIELFLSRKGYQVEFATGGEDGLIKFGQVDPDLIILDVMMPGKDGWEICRRIRDTSEVPIIMLTARDSESDRVMGLRLGADDYVCKPFSLKELEARIVAVLRRTNRADARGSDKSFIYDDGHLRIESTGMQVLRDGETINLTVTERKLLFQLAQSANHVFSTDQILSMVWGKEYRGQTDYVKLYVWRLRQKLEPNTSKPIYIKTERGLGYRFVSQIKEED